MDKHNYIHIWLVIYQLINILLLTKGEILNNPLELSISSNPILHNLTNEITIYSSDNKLIQNAITRETISSDSFCSLSDINTLILNSETNNYYIYSLSSQYLISLSDNNCQSKLISDIDFSQTIEYLGNIYEGYFDPENFYEIGSVPMTDLRCKQLDNEIIIYGKTDSNAGFYFLEKDIMVNIGITCTIEDIFYCNKVDNSLYICIFICSNKINIEFFAYITPDEDAQGDCQMNKIYSDTINSGSFTHLMTIDIENEILICAINDGNKEVECFIIDYLYNEYKANITDPENEGNNYFINKFNITMERSQSSILSLDLDDSNNHYCILKASVEDEYLLCCGGDNIIRCIRINKNIQKINSFDLDIEGTNTNINFISFSQYIHLFYKNNKDSTDKYYEYSINIPQCSNKIYSLVPLGTFSDEVNNLFIKKINTNYYIKFISFPSDYGQLSFNNELIEENFTSFETQLIEDNYLFEFTSTDSESMYDLEIKYEIILEETFSSECSVKINIVECYRSCKICSKSNDESNSLNHNCISGQCNLNYYQDPDIETNCWDIFEAKSNWYLDEQQNKFFYCNEECPTCDGPTNEDCLSCKSDSDSKYLYNKKCYDKCPDGYYPSLQSKGYYLCKECYSTCETCIDEGSQYNMNCITCKPNSIIFRKNCFLIEDEEKKSFYRPWDNTISSCYEEYNYYVKEDNNTCISNIPEGYYLSNEQTGLISHCHSDCKTCIEGYTNDNSKCILCNDENLNLYNGNCILNCPEGYYSKPKSETNEQKRCMRCYYTCKKCEEGEIMNSGILKNMNCLECKKDENDLDKYIKVNNNCFTISDYAEDKINFDTSLINLNDDNKIKTCLYYNLSIIYGEYECKTKPTNSYYINTENNYGIIKLCDTSCATCNEGKDTLTGNTNCLTCSDGYYKKEESNTNCILESLIPDIYYKYTLDNIFYKCYNLCSKCVRELDYKTSLEKMGCASCITNYYLVEDTTNCYDITFLDTHTNYFLSTEDNMFKKCYNSCKKCSQSFIDEYNHNCDECLDNYYFEEDTKNCYDLSFTEKGYYLDQSGEKPIFKKCYINCKTCSNYLVDDNMNCLLCKEGLFKIYETNNCIDDITNKGYYGINGVAYPCERNCLTCSNGKTAINVNNLNNDNEIITEFTYNCLSCDEENKNLFLVENLNNCESENFKNEGFYLEESEDNIKIFKKCYKSCSLCNKGFEIEPSNNKENHNCEKCSKNYYRLRDDTQEKNCYGEEMIEKGYRLVRNYWQICYDSCDTCSDNPPLFDLTKNILISHNCDTCYIGYNFIYQTKDCVNETYLEKGYYLDDNDNYYKKCDISCGTCNKYSNSENPRCIKCNTDLLYFKAEKKPNDICYNKTMIDEEYVLSERYDEEGNSYKIWGFCYETCITCLKFGDKEEHGCTKCIPKYYLIYNTTNCVTDNDAINNGYYFNNTFLKFVPCDDSCINCYGAPKEGTTNCKKCNNEKGYYNIEGKTKTLCKNEKTIEEGYFLNKISEPYEWNECYENCATCEYKGIESNMKCLSCRTNLINKLNKTKYFILLDGNCIESCENNLFLTKDGDCVSECPEGTYHFILDYNYSCLESCPKKYIISSDKKRCQLDEFPKNTTIKEFKDIILDKIYNYVNSTRIINFDKFKAKVISSGDLNLKELNAKQIFSINNLEDILDEIKEANDLDDNDDIIITQIEYDSNLEISKNLELNKNYINLGENIEIFLYDSYGNKLIIPQSISEFFSITKYIGNLLYINFNESKWFYEKDIDVFDKEDSFFNDICYPFKTKYNSDATLENRRNNYYQNVNFCGDYCIYNKINYDLMNANCLCNSSLLNTETNVEKKYLLNNKNIFKKGLPKTNLILIKCINLVFDSEIIKTNIGFISHIILLSFESIVFLIFFKNGLKPIKNFILIFEPNSIASPPKLTELLALAEPKDNKKDEVKKSKLINHLITAKRRKRDPEIKDADDALVVNYNNSENEENVKNDDKSSESSDNSKNNNEKKTNLKKSEKKKLKTRNEKIYKNKINNEEKEDSKQNNYKKGSHIHYNQDNYVNPELLKKHMKLGKIHISNYQYLNKNTEEIDIKNNNEKDNDLNKEELEKENKKNIKKFKNQRKNNYLYSRQEFLFMDYEEAIKKEIKFSDIYYTYLIENNFILNTINSDSFINLNTIKINYLLFRTELILAFNSLFYSDKYISQVFENNGKLDFLYSLPKSIYSTLMTILISIALKFLLNNKKEIINLIQNKDNTKFHNTMKKILEIIKIKLIIYFSIELFFTLFFLYYCSAFCALYQNSQIFWIYGCLETILFDFIFSFIYCLFVALCRFIGIKKRKKCLYIISKIINYL